MSDQIEAFAKDAGISRPEAIRRLVAIGLAATNAARGKLGDRK